MVKRNLRQLQTAGAAILLLASLLPAGKPGGKPNQPTKVPAISDFQGAISTDGVPYADENLSGGWSNFPDTGNYTLQLDGGGGAARMIHLDFRTAIGVAEFRNELFTTSLFLSINRVCTADQFIGGTCTDASTSDGSLRDMKLGGPDLLVNLRARFKDPDNNRSEILLRCGPEFVPRDPDLDASNQEPIFATCMRGRDGDNSCLEWQLSGGGGDGTLACSVWRTSAKGSITSLGVYDMPFTVLLQRDENGDGIAD